jgi:hypothetical protein
VPLLHPVLQCWKRELLCSMPRRDVDRMAGHSWRGGCTLMPQALLELLIVVRRSLSELLRDRVHRPNPLADVAAGVYLLG